MNRFNVFVYLMQCTYFAFSQLCYVSAPPCVLKFFEKIYQKVKNHTFYTHFIAAGRFYANVPQPIIRISVIRIRNI